MISQLTGKLISKHPPFIVLDVNGVGYEAETSLQTFCQLPEVGQALTILTQLIVREDAHLLFGFYKEEERKLFRTLLKVNGVGPKLALAILSSMDPSTFIQSIQQHDISMLTKIPGVGKKTAERLVVEMHDRLQHWDKDLTSGLTPLHSVLQISVDPRTDAIGALIALGYKPNEAQQAVKKVAAENMDSAEMIRLALQQFLK